jgi:hypothetical protein
MMDEFLRLAKANTTRNLETCGVLAGSLVSTIQPIYFPANHDFIFVRQTISFPDLCDSCGIRLTNFLTRNRPLGLILQKKGIFYVSTLIIPKQEATSDSVSFSSLLSFLSQGGRKK